MIEATHNTSAATASAAATAATMAAPMPSRMAQRLRGAAAGSAGATKAPSAVMSIVRITRRTITCNWRGAAPKQGHCLRRRAGFAAALALLLLGGAGSAGALPPGTSDVPANVRDQVEAALAPNLVIPETAIWSFAFMAPYVNGGNVVCGAVDYQSAMRVYVGPKRFYAFVKRGVVTFSQLQDPPVIATSGQGASQKYIETDKSTGCILGKTTS